MGRGPYRGLRLTTKELRLCRISQRKSNVDGIYLLSGLNFFGLATKAGKSFLTPDSRAIARDAATENRLPKMNDAKSSVVSNPTGPESSVVALIREAVTNKVDAAQLRELLAVRREWESDEARKSFSLAISEFQKRAPIVEKGDDANGKAYARMDRIWRTVRPLLTELGLSVTWQVAEIRSEGQVCHLEGMLRHRDGHFQELRFDIPIPDAISNSSGKAVQNKAQVMGSAMTYTQRYALCASLGVVTGDDNDGHLTVTEEQEKQIKELLIFARTVPGFDEKIFWGLAGCGEVREIYAKDADKAVEWLNARVRGSGRKQFEGGRWKTVKIHFGKKYKDMELGKMPAVLLAEWIKWAPGAAPSEEDKFLRLALDVAKVEAQ